MIEVRREGDTIVFEVLGMHKVWALKSRLEIPAAHIRGARKDPEAVKGWKGWRAPGTYIPGIITAGTFYLQGRRIFWDACDPDRVIVVDLEDDTYDQLIIEVEHPRSVVELLNGGR